MFYKRSDTLNFLWEARGIATFKIYNKTETVIEKKAYNNITINPNKFEYGLYYWIVIYESKEIEINKFYILP